MSTLNLLSGLMTPDFLRTAAQATGESEGGVAKALGAAFPAVLGQLAQGAGNSTLMGKVADMARNPMIEALMGPGGGILASVGSMLSPGAVNSPVGSIGSSLLAGLFGNNIGGLAGALGSLAGLKNAGSASSLLGLAAPMVLAALGNKLGGSLTGTALAVLLGQEKNSIMSAIPGALSGAMGLLGGAPAAPSMAAPSMAPVAAAAATVATAAGAMASQAANQATSAASAATATATTAVKSAAAAVQAPIVAAPQAVKTAAATVAAAAPAAATMAAAPAAMAKPAAPMASPSMPTAAAGHAHAHAHAAVEEAQPSFLSTILWIIGLSAMMGAVVFGITQCAQNVQVKAPAVVKKAEAPAPVAKAPEAPKPVEKPKVVEAPKPAPAPAPVAAPAPAAPAAVAKAVSLLASMKPGDGGLFNLPLPTGKTIAIAEKGVETELIGFLEDKSQPIDKGTWFNFDRLTFKTASTDLTPESKSQVESITEILKAFPTSHIKIGGYTDNQGDPAMNLKLSDDRAKRVMSEIVGLGIAPDRLAAEGYGDQHAIGDNGTPEGRAKNRRTALSVRQR